MFVSKPINNPSSVLTITEPDKVRELVLSIVQGKQDYQDFVKLLEPITSRAGILENDVALTLALLLKDVEKHGDLNDKLHDLSENIGLPSLAINKDGSIVAANPSAMSLYELTQGYNDVYSLGVSKKEFSDFLRRIYHHQGPSLLKTFSRNKSDEQDESKKSQSIILIGLYDEEHQLFWLHAVESQWSGSINQAFKEIFSLTDAECEILSQMAQGMGSEKISQLRNRSIGTVRQQIKSLLNKLGASSQVQAAAMASAISGQAALHNHHALSLKKCNAIFESGDVSYSDRRVFWRRYGKKNGYPILLFHGAYFGAGEYENDRKWAYENNLDVVVVERLGYGHGQPPSNMNEALKIQIEDCLAVVKYFQWQSFYVMSQDFGLVPALAFAQRFSASIQGILAISPPVIYSDKQNENFEHIPRNQRVYIWAARHAFWMIRILLRMSQVKARKYGPENWMKMVFEGAPHELPIYENPQNQQGAAAAYFYNLQQKSKGNEIDMWLTVASDWKYLLEATSIPIIAMSGGLNNTFPIEKVRQLTTVNPNVTLHEYDDAGLSLCVTHGQHCYQLLRENIEKYLAK